MLFRSCVVPESKLNKRHNILFYHFVGKIIACKFVNLQHVASEWNMADVISKHWSYQKVYKKILKPILHFKGDTSALLGRPIAYWSRSLQSNQLKYTTTKKELLAIILCLKEYEQILYRAKIEIYTDHKNLTFKTLSIKRILWWRTYIDQYDVDLKYISGNKNVLVDCFS